MRPRFPRPMKRRDGSKMNDYERAYQDQVLVQHLHSGHSARFGYEDITLVLCEGIRYTPDYSEVLEDRIRLIEVKAGDKTMKPLWTDGARHKFKQARDKFVEYDWVLAVVRKIPKRDGGGWEIKEIGNGVD